MCVYKVNVGKRGEDGSVQISSALPNYESTVEGEFAFCALVTIAFKMINSCIN